MNRIINLDPAAFKLLYLWVMYDNAADLYFIAIQERFLMTKHLAIKALKDLALSNFATGDGFLQYSLWKVTDEGKKFFLPIINNSDQIKESVLINNNIEKKFFFHPDTELLASLASENIQEPTRSKIATLPGLTPLHVQRYAEITKRELRDNYKVGALINTLRGLPENPELPPEPFRFTIPDEPETAPELPTEPDPTPEPTITGWNGIGINPLSAWSKVLEQLQYELSRASYQTYAQHTQLKSYHAGTYTILAENQFAKDWLTDRLTATATRILEGLCNQSISLIFETED